MLFGTNMNMALLLSAAFDRLFAVAAPHMYANLNQILKKIRSSSDTNVFASNTKLPT